jgi:hypothetical protein
MDHALKTYLVGLKTEEARKAFGLRCDSSLGHLRNLLYVEGKTCAPKLAARIEVESGGGVRRWDMRPDDWHLIWPELVKAKGAPRVVKQAA